MLKSDLGYNIWMKFKRQQLIYGLFLALIALVLYLGRAMLAPFVLAAIFAYILNPLVDFLAHKMRLPRGLSVAIIYIVLIGLIAVLAVNIGIRISEESAQFSLEAKTFLRETNSQISSFPDWLRPISLDIVESVRGSVPFTNKRVMAYLPGALNRTIGVLVFLTSAFYFLKDGKNFKNGFMNLLPSEIKEDLEAILHKINRVLGDYLRGQLLLVLIMSVLTYIGLTIIGVRYGLILAVFTGFAEIIPIIGPIVAGTVAVLVAFTDQYSRLGINPTLDVVVVASLYVVLRQIEDIFIIPQVMGRMTKLHPLVVLFSVLIGGHIFGVMGYLIAVPLAASLKVVLDHYATKKPRLAGEAGPESE